MSFQTRSARRRAREFALQAIYAWMMGGCDPNDRGVVDAHIREQEEFHLADQAWYTTLIDGVFLHIDTLRAEFAPFIDREPQELSPIEHSILLLATFELKHMIDVPYKVVINEAVELSKEFGGTDGFKFVNGVLDKLGLTLRPHRR